MRRLDLPRRRQRVIGRHDPRPGPARDLDEALRSAHVQRAKPDLGRNSRHGVQDAEVEGLHHRPLFQFVPLDRLVHQLGETPRWRRKRRTIREALDFDVEQEIAAVRQIEDLIQRRHARAWDRRLFGKARIPHGAAVPAFQFGEGQLPDGARRVGRTADPAVHFRIVRNHHHVVARNRHVHLQRVRAHLDGVLKSGQRIFRTHGARPAMTVYQDGPSHRI